MPIDTAASQGEEQGPNEAELEPSSSKVSQNIHPRPAYRVSADGSTEEDLVLDRCERTTRTQVQWSPEAVAHYWDLNIHHLQDTKAEIFYLLNSLNSPKCLEKFMELGQF
ncbi:hypothetical protein AOLI_G00275060 [Acnodon oligacanthus]